MKRLQIITLFFLGFRAAYAADPGTTSANFLKLGIGPRAVAMGEAQVAVADDVYATYWNPAGLAQLQYREAGFVQTQYIQDIQAEYAAYAHPTPLGTFAGSINYLNVGKFDGYDAVGQPIGEVGANDTAMAFSYGVPIIQNRRLGTELAVGATGKYIQERLDTVTAHGYSTDLGVLFVPGQMFGEALQGFKAGLAIRNMGPSMKYDQDAFSLPRTAAAGVSWTGVWLGESLTLAMDGEKPNDGKTVVGAGAELTTLQLLVIRGGYTSQGDLGNGLRLGAGLRFKTVQVDYAFASAGDLGQIHRFGLTFRFGVAPQDPLVLAQDYFTQGIREYSRSHYSEAMVDFNKTLEIDPTHPEALKMMKETYEKLKATNPE